MVYGCLAIADFVDCHGSTTRHCLPAQTSAAVAGRAAHCYFRRITEPDESEPSVDDDNNTGVGRHIVTTAASSHVRTTAGRTARRDSADHRSPINAVQLSPPSLRSPAAAGLVRSPLDAVNVA